MNIKKKLGNKIKELRLKNSYTQDALSEKLDISPKSVSQIELGNNFVSAETLEKFGAVSKECAVEMAVGLHSRTNADVVICTTGIAGPTGGTPTKPVGLMYVAIKSKYKAVVQEFRLNPKIKRTKMKYKFTQCALEMLLDFLSDISA